MQQQQFSSVTKTYLCRFYEILDEMIDGMTNAKLTDSISPNFIVQMIPHHQATFCMSKNALHFDICPELIPILQTIISSQEKGVQEMERLLKKISRGCERE
mgnify:FL=1